MALAPQSKDECDKAGWELMEGEAIKSVRLSLSKPFDKLRVTMICYRIGQDDSITVRAYFRHPVKR
jgi:hypothetical protein